MPIGRTGLPVKAISVIVQDDILDLSTPLGTGQRSFGAIGNWGLGPLGVDRDTATIAKNGLWMGILLCGCLGFMSWGMGRWLASRLTRFSKELAGREPQDYRHFHIRGNDEVGRLVQSFNDLQDRLKEAQDHRQKSENERQETTQMMIHDLKGPLGVFAAGLELLGKSVRSSGDDSQN